MGSLMHLRLVGRTLNAYNAGMRVSELSNDVVQWLHEEGWHRVGATSFQRECCCVIEWARAYNRVQNRFFEWVIMVNRIQ